MTFREYIKLAFSDNGQPSSSRLLTALTFLSACAGFLYIVVKTRTMPDGGSLIGLGTFAASPYAVNKVSNIFKKDKEPETDTTVVVKTDTK